MRIKFERLEIEIDDSTVEDLIRPAPSGERQQFVAAMLQVIMPLLEQFLAPQGSSDQQTVTHRAVSVEELEDLLARAKAARLAAQKPPAPESDTE